MLVSINDHSPGNPLRFYFLLKIPFKDTDTVTELKAEMPQTYSRVQRKYLVFYYENVILCQLLTFKSDREYNLNNRKNSSLIK